MNLEQLQADFQRIVLSPECEGADWVSAPAQGLSAQDRLDIYHNAYRIRLIDVLLDTFEHTAVYLGDDWFHQLASAFVQSHNSTHNNIGFYGREFPKFLAEQHADDLEIAELARMDWTLRRAFDGPDSDVMTLDDLQALASGDSTADILHAVPTASIETHHFNTLDIWHAINHDQHPPDVEQLPQPVDILIWRKGHSPHFRSLSALESLAIRNVTTGSSLEAIGAAIESNFPQADAANEFGMMLYRWIDEELLVRA